MVGEADAEGETHRRADHREFCGGSQRQDPDAPAQPGLRESSAAFLAMIEA